MTDVSSNRLSTWVAVAAAIAALISAGASAISAGASARQTSLLKQAANDALIANLQTRFVAACSQALPYFHDRYDAQVNVLATMSENGREFSFASRAMIVNKQMENIDFESSGRELRRNFQALELLFPDNQEIAEFGHLIGVFEFSFTQYVSYFFLFSEELGTKVANKDNEFRRKAGSDNLSDRLDISKGYFMESIAVPWSAPEEGGEIGRAQVVIEYAKKGISENSVLSPSEMQEHLEALSNSSGKIWKLCQESTRIGA